MVSCLCDLCTIMEDAVFRHSNRPKVRRMIAYMSFTPGALFGTVAYRVLDPDTGKGKLAGEPRNDPQHTGDCGLLLSRRGQFAGKEGDLLLEPRDYFGAEPIAGGCASAWSSCRARSLVYGLSCRAASPGPPGRCSRRVVQHSKLAAGAPRMGWTRRAPAPNDSQRRRGLAARGTSPCPGRQIL